ncbi:hypothetical protein [Paenibacillus silviterrae]|uniref:hypothetical protein n=1 Tax=Paenibacillus silviterrae TaxID=3242194 RepID=UPI00254298E4|nr:hypothetical protein [Paenibacillus chinjuensis]
MTKLKLVLLDEDAYFSDMLAMFIRTTDYSERFAVQRFTSRESAMHYVAREREPFLLLVHEAFLPLPDHVFELRAGSMMVLSEANGSGGIVEYPVLFKYQPLDQMLSTVSGHYNELCEAAPLHGQRASQIIGLYSAVGGAGKTVAASHLARHWVQQGEKVMCVSLEQQPSYAWYPQEMLAGGLSAEDPFAELLYYIRAQPKQVPAKLEQVKRRHPRGRYDYLIPSSSWRELLEWQAEDVRVLLESLAVLGGYDRIVLDLDSSFHPSNLEAIRRCDALYWLLLDDVVHLDKAALCLERMGAQLGIREGASLGDDVIFVLNKSRGAVLNVGSVQGFRLRGELPYIPEWKAVDRVEELYSGALAEAWGRIVSRKEGMVKSHVVNGNEARAESQNSGAAGSRAVIDG